jgi:hypothetical protein
MILCQFFLMYSQCIIYSCPVKLQLSNLYLGFQNKGDYYYYCFIQNFLNEGTNTISSLNDSGGFVIR